VLDIAELLLRFVVPLLVMAVTNTWSLVIVRRSDVFRQKFEAAKNTTVLKKPKCLMLTVGIVVIFFLTQIFNAGIRADGMVFGIEHRGTFEMEAVVTISNVLQKANSLVNFFIYIILDKEFRATAWSMLRWRIQNACING
jgi:hypothetical protein